MDLYVTNVNQWLKYIQQGKQTIISYSHLHVKASPISWHRNTSSNNNYLAEHIGVLWLYLLSYFEYTYTKQYRVFLEW
jgi:hypothetical protein